MKGKVLIFGANGFVGKYLAMELHRNEYIVYGSDILQSADSVYDAFFTGDLTKKEDVTCIIKDIMPDYIINLAAISSVAQSWMMPQIVFNVNVLGTINILEAIKECEVPCRTLLIGSSEEYAVTTTRITEDSLLDPVNPYGISKLTQENIARLYSKRYGLEIICTRTFNHTGKGQSPQFVIPSFVHQVFLINSGITKEAQIHVGNLDIFRDIGDVRDMVKAYRLLLECKTKYFVYNVGAGTTYKLFDLLDYIISLGSCPISVCVDKERVRPADNSFIWCDNSRIKNEIGWTYEYNVFDSIQSIWNEYISGRKE